MMRLLIIVPAYNEAGNLGRLLRAIRGCGLQQDILVVDDGSRDQTAEEAAGEGVLLVKHPVNLGVGAAEQTGYLFALEHGYDAVLRLDADGQHPPAAVPLLLAELERGEADVVIGSRFLEVEGFRPSWPRRFGIRYLSWLIAAISGLRITDPTSGMRVVNQKALSLLAQVHPEDYPEPESLLWLQRCGCRVREVGVRMAERAGGSSSIDASASFYYLAKVSVALLIGALRSPGRS